MIVKCQNQAGHFSFLDTCLLSWDSYKPHLNNIQGLRKEFIKQGTFSYMILHVYVNNFSMEIKMLIMVYIK